MKICKQLGEEIRDKISRNEDIDDICAWIYSLYFCSKDSLSEELYNQLDIFIKKIEELKNLHTYEFLEKFSNELINNNFDTLAIDSPEYLRKKFGSMLKEKINLGVEHELIGKWAFEYYFVHMLEIDNDFAEILLSLNAMEEGAEFEMSYEVLAEIADDLLK